MPVNLVPLPPLDPLALSLYRLCTTAFLVSPGSSNDPIYHALAVLLLHLALLVGREEADADAAAAEQLTHAHSGFAASATSPCQLELSSPHRHLRENTMHMVMVGPCTRFGAKGGFHGRAKLSWAWYGTLSP